MNEVLIIAVNYNTPVEAMRFLKSIESQNYFNARVVLVDNSDGNIDLSFEDSIKNIKVNITYLKSPKNLGYFGGADYGLNYFFKENALPQWVIVSNVDIVFNQPGFFERLFSMKFAPDVGVIAPSIISKKWKTDTNPKVMKKYTKQRMDFYLRVCTNKLTQNIYMTTSYIKKKVKYLKSNFSAKEEALNKTEMKKIYAPHGSCILFHQNYFKRGGDLKHISFLFGEEIFVAEKAQSLNLEIWYVPQLRVYDYEHASTGFFYSSKIAGFMKQSTMDIINHYYKEG